MKIVRPILLPVFLALFSLGTFVIPCTPAEEPDVKSVIDEAVSHWDRLVSTYRERGVQLAFSIDTFYPDYKRTVAVLGASEWNRVEKKNGDECQVYAMNDSYSFRLARQSDSAWSLTDLCFPPDDYIDRANRRMETLSLTPYLYSGVVLHDSWLADIFRCDSFTVNSLTEPVEEPNKIIIDFDVNFAASNCHRITHGVLHLDKEKEWTIAHAEYTLFENQADNQSEEHHITLDIDYREKDGCFFPAQMTKTIVKAKTPNEPICQEEVVYEEPSFGALSEQDFQLSGYGLAEPIDVSASERMSAALVKREKIDDNGNFSFTFKLTNTTALPLTLCGSAKNWCDASGCYSIGTSFPVTIPANGEALFEMEGALRKGGADSANLTFYVEEKEKKTTVPITVPLPLSTLE